MEIKELFGLPAHPLVVHAAVVLLPLAAVATLVCAAVPRARRSYALRRLHPTRSYVAPSRSNGRSSWYEDGSRGTATRLTVPSHVIGTHTTMNANALLRGPNLRHVANNSVAPTTVGTPMNQSRRTLRS